MKNYSTFKSIDKKQLIVLLSSSCTLLLLLLLLASKFVQGGWFHNTTNSLGPTNKKFQLSNVASLASIPRGI